MTENFRLVTQTPADGLIVGFSETLASHLMSMFQVSDVQSLPDNYGVAHSWSLLQAVDNPEMIDSYSVLYVDDCCWGGGGGRVSLYQDHPVYQAGWRTFLNKDPNERLGKYPFFVNHILQPQIERAKHLGLSEVILSFNDHNAHLFKVMKRRLTSNLRIDWWCETEMKQFNGVPQWLIHIPL